MTDPAGNNFNLVRLVAASLVIVSHGIELPSRGMARDGLHALTGHTLSWYAVGAFFAVSGYLISESWLRRPDLVTFLRARALRILPGLAFMLVLVVPLAGLFFGSLAFGDFLKAPGTWRYIAGNLSIFAVQYELPGVFTGNPLPAVNGSLWTLRYEVLCYAGIAMLGVSGLMLHERARLIALLGVLGASVLLSIWLGLGPKPTGKAMLLAELGRLTTAFVLGALFRDLRSRWALRGWMLLPLWGVLPLVAGTPVAASLGSLAAAATAFCLAFLPQQAWLKPLRTGPDYSYGIYIYAFPVQQALVALFPQGGAWLNIGLGLALTLPFAALSWHLVEKPALRWKVAPSRPATPPAAR
jgi:peptidoglycan/LPS O-acetylase OafA/YrhL